MTRVPPALTALTSRTGLRRVLFAYWVYNLVEIAAWLVIVLWAYAEGGAQLAGFAAVVQLIPAALLATVLAGVGDRISRGTALVVAHGSVAVASSLTTLALVTDAPVGLVIAASTTITTTVAVVRPIHYATLPQLANSADELVSGYALSSGGEQFAFFAGPIVAGFGVELWGASAVMAGAAVASLIGTLLCVRLRLVAPPADDDEPAGLRAAVEGLIALRGDWGSLALLLVLATTFVLAGALDVLGVAFADTVLGRGESGAGLVVGAVGIGGMVGAVFATALAWRRRLTPMIAGAGIVQGLACAMCRSSPYFRRTRSSASPSGPDGPTSRPAPSSFAKGTQVTSSSSSARASSPSPSTASCCPRCSSPAPGLARSHYYTRFPGLQPSPL